ncbi:MAG: PorT family protein [Bacteroidales bacterium]|nr:PorT family protein [Bacteroidales bacterium]
MQVENTPLLDVFNSITAQTGLRFAYNPDILDLKTRISIDVVKGCPDTVLSLILPPSVKYRIVEDYIILTAENTNETGLALDNSVRDTVFVQDTVYLHQDSILAILKEIKQNLHELLNTKKSSLPHGNWIVAISSGLRSETGFATNYSRSVRNNNLKLSVPSVEFRFGYMFSNRIQVETGVKYVQNFADYSFEAFDWGGNTTVDERHLLFSSLQIPLDMKYYISFGKSNFSLFVKGGIDFGIPVDKRSTQFVEAEDVPTGVFLWESSPDAKNQTLQRLHYSTRIESPLQKMNVLLSLGAGISYQFPFGLGLSIYGEYYAGTANMARIAITCRQEQFNAVSKTWDFYNENVEYVTCRGDCRNFGLTVSYKFKHKKTPISD